MRRVLCGLAAGVIVCHAAVAQAQQGSVQISAAGQGVTGNPQRIAGENQFEPDFGIAWLQPGVRFGTFQIELRGTKRAERLHLGRNYAALRDLKRGQYSWTFEAGDAYFNRALGGYGFSNLSTPAVTFSGGAIEARSDRATLNIVGGRATAWRNIFGTDPDTMAQTLGMARGTFRVNDRLDVLGRVSRISTSGLREFTFNIADSRQAGGGARFSLTPAVQLVADGSYVLYRRLDSNIQHRDGSMLVGANFLLSRGWVQINAARFSPGDFPAMNDPLHDRESAFAATEFDVWSRVRLFGGWEGIRTNIDPEPTLESSSSLPRNTASRGFGGVRVQFGPRSILTLRAENGDRITRPAQFGREIESDTGLRSAELQSSFGPITTYTRLSRRENVDRASLDATYTQDDLAAQLFMRLSRSTQLFGLGTYTRHRAATAAGTSYWQIGGGTQVQLTDRNLWIRGEGTASRNVDLLTRDFVPRASFNIGLNGELSRSTSFALNIAADRTPVLFGTGTPWTTRSIFRVVQTFSTGAARVSSGTSPAAVAATRSRGTGTILGVVFTDWNGNGILDPGEDPLENIPVRITAVSALTTRRDGEFSFLNVPAGAQEVGLDTSAIPVDFDPPVESSVSLELDRGTTRRVTFGLIPLGSLRGRVVRDANGNGRADPGEEAIDGAILVLDRGARSEQVRRGTYRFDSIRSGDHVVALIRESLPEGAVITGATEVPVALRRDQLSLEIDFLVTIEKRPETRKVFPSKIGAPQPPAPKPSAADRPAAKPPAAGTPAGAGPTATGSASGVGPAAARVPAAEAERKAAPVARNNTPAAIRPGSAAAGSIEDNFAVQVAALLDPLRARQMAAELSARGYPAYVMEPAADEPDGPYRVRIGHYRTRAAAAAAGARLERARGEKLWVIREQ
jgi:cell division septation protein DedD